MFGGNVSIIMPTPFSLWKFVQLYSHHTTKKIAQIKDQKTYIIKCVSVRDTFFCLYVRIYCTYTKTRIIKLSLYGTLYGTVRYMAFFVLLFHRFTFFSFEWRQTSPNRYYRSNLKQDSLLMKLFVLQVQLLLTHESNRKY